MMPRRVSVDEVRRRLQAGDPTLLLVWSFGREKFEQGHPEGAISFEDLEARLAELSRDTEILFY